MRETKSVRPRADFISRLTPYKEGVSVVDLVSETEHLRVVINSLFAW